MSLTSFLDVSVAPRPADVLFVFAGREERKRFGLELFEKGYAPRIILSVGRFEWRRFAALGLPDDGGLVDLVQTIEPTERHFFVELREGRTSCRHVRTGRYGTWSEARALAAYVTSQDAHSVLVVSSPIHLRRAVLALRHFLPEGAELIPVASPPSPDSPARELVKLAGYWVLSRLKPHRRLSCK